MIEIYNQFKEGLKNDTFYWFLIIRKVLNICLILILAVSIKKVLKEIKGQNKLTVKVEDIAIIEKTIKN